MGTFISKQFQHRYSLVPLKEGSVIPAHRRDKKSGDRRNSILHRNYNYFGFDVICPKVSENLVVTVFTVEFMTTCAGVYRCIVDLGTK